MAVKVLLSASLDAYGGGGQEEVARRALTLSSPVLASLQKGGRAGRLFACVYLGKGRSKAGPAARGAQC